MNTALAYFRVGWFGNHWVITSGEQTFTTRSVSELTRILRGRGPDPKPEPPTGPKPAPSETMEEFLARGGKITRITPTALAFPPPLPHNLVYRPSPGRITLDSLGFKTPPKVPSLTSDTPAPEPVLTPANSAFEAQLLETTPNVHPQHD
jgi:hypothetical protein